MAKVITKMMHEKLDAFVLRTPEQANQENETGETLSGVKENKKIIKKNSDGLMEKMEPKIIIAEDNRRFLRD